MGYSHDPSFYPPEFQEIFRRALDKDKIEIPCENHQQATNLRHQFHAYRRAVEEHKLEGWSDLRKITISLEGNNLIFSSNEELMNRLRAAAGMTEPSEADIDKYLDELDKGDTR
ncbi:MAG: hypothetical protein KAJ19_25535 [Gammaproteobacteria bacterium]|nr:hypothetical protein [Gammaproteobacteria bacterium]